MHGRALTLAGLVAFAIAAADAAAAQPWGPPPGRDHYRGDPYAGRPDWDDRDARGGRRGYGRRRRCDRGTGGTILGAIAGGLLGNAAVGRGDRELGTIVGAGAGALAGRAIDRDC